MIDYPVHPAAAVFPMLAEDELADLAADIKANGLHHPIVLDKDGTLIDGRNRLAACHLAGVVPATTTLNGHDPVAYILSENIRRRHLSKGQQAMATVMVSGNHSQRQMATMIGASQDRIKAASIVLQYAPDLADLVLAGLEFLDKAYAIARERKQAQESQAQRDARARAEAEAKTGRLRAAAPTSRTPSRSSCRRTSSAGT